MPTFTGNLSNRVVSNNLPSTNISYASQTFLGNLPNVSLDNPTPEDEVLSFNATTGYWVNRPISVDRCTDTGLTSLSNNDILFYNVSTSKFENKSLNIDSCQDVSLSNPQSDDILFYNNSTSKFENKDTSYFATKVGEAATSLGTLTTNISGDSGTLNNYTAKQINEYSFVMSLIL